MSQQVPGPRSGPATRRRLRIPALLAIGILPAAFLANPSIAQAAPLAFYVDKTMRACSDSGPGTAARPFCTLTKGVSRTTAGYTLYIGWGNFAETIRPIASGTAARPIRITAWPGRSPIIGSGLTNGANISGRSYITLSYLRFSGTVADGIYVSRSHHITVTNNTVSGAGRPAQGRTAPGISVRGVSASVVRYNNVHHNNGSGIFLTAGTTGTTVSGNSVSYNAEGWRRNANGILVTAPGNAVLRNVTHNNEDSGIQFYTGGNNNLAALNLTVNNGDHGIDNYNVTGGRMISNTVYRNCTSGINVEGTSRNYQVFNNIAVDNAVYPAYKGISCARRAGNIGIWDSAPASTTVNHNLVWLTKSGVMYAFGTTYTSLAAMRTARRQEANGIQANPRFVSAAGWNFRLLAGSPAIDRGHSGVSGAQWTDIVGRTRVDIASASNSSAAGPRRYDDLGVYEFRP
jgi:parallel beta-helix repeat protein